MPIDYNAPRCFCGRLDPHEMHNWGGIHGVGVGIAPRKVVYLCYGPPIIEGASDAQRSF